MIVIKMQISLLKGRAGRETEEEESGIGTDSLLRIRNNSSCCNAVSASDSLLCDDRWVWNFYVVEEEMGTVRGPH